MRISDEKRCEIAASLRESREFISGLPKASLEQNALDTFERILACVDYEQGNIFDYLADLIDRPTCKTIEHGRPDEFHVCKSCSRCSYGWFEDIYDKPYSYCPNCGAEVTTCATDAKLAQGKEQRG